MIYLGENIPKLGFGFMRLPMIGEEIDIEQTKEMVDLFISKGFSYFDSSWGYNGGKSEEAMKAFKSRPNALLGLLKPQRRPRI